MRKQKKYTILKQMIHQAVDIVIVKLFFCNNFFSELSWWFIDYELNYVFISNV